MGSKNNLKIEIFVYRTVLSKLLMSKFLQCTLELPISILQCIIYNKFLLNNYDNCKQRYCCYNVFSYVQTTLNSLAFLYRVYLLVKVSIALKMERNIPDNSLSLSFS